MGEIFNMLTDSPKRNLLMEILHTIYISFLFVHSLLSVFSLRNSLLEALIYIDFHQCFFPVSFI